MTPRVSRRFLIAFAALALVAAAGALLWKTRIAGCPARGYAPDRILASCSVPSYGDYEQGVLAHGLEPRADAALRAADVVAVGYSHGHRALSGEATRQYFEVLGRTFHNLSASGTNSAFADIVFARLRLRPRVVVVDADPFFVPAGSASLPPATRRIATEPARSRVEYAAKGLWQALHRRVCPGGPAWFCAGGFSFYRDLLTGRLLIDYREVYGDPLPRIPVVRDRAVDPALAAAYGAHAKAFLTRHGLDPACTIVTVVPSNRGNERLAEGIAAAAGAPYVNAAMDGLTTVDGGHLDDESLERWSAAFWREARPVLDRCLGLASG